jgi:replication initiation and membrane attachment protein DnaB
MCSKDKHPHYNISITDFKSLFNKKIAEKRGKLQNINYDETPIELIAKNYKAEIDQDQLKVIEGIMKELK